MCLELSRSSLRLPPTPGLRLLSHLDLRVSDQLTTAKKTVVEEPELFAPLAPPSTPLFIHRFFELLSTKLVAPLVLDLGPTMYEDGEKKESGSESEANVHDLSQPSQLLLHLDPFFLNSSLSLLNRRSKKISTDPLMKRSLLVDAADRESSLSRSQRSPSMNQAFSH